MGLENIERNFLAIWRMALNMPSLENLNVSLITTFCEKKNVNIEKIEESEIGVFKKTKSIILTTTDGHKACFPKISHCCDEEWRKSKALAERDIALLDKMEWFFPLWIPIGKVNNILHEVEKCSKDRAIELFNYHTSTLYTLSFQAVCVAQIFPKCESLKDFSAIAREAYLAFYSGHRASSIAALIPVIEGALTRMVSEKYTGLSLHDKINKVIDGSIEKATNIYFDGMWAPWEYRTVEYLIGLDERVLFFETYRRWLQNSFFKNTQEYDGVTWLNRHLFAHAEASSWQNSGNFCRLVVALATLGVVESWYKGSGGMSLFFPDINEESELLWQQAIFQAQSQFVIKSIEAQNYQQRGRLVPEMPTDDGVLLRKAVLSEDCINDLVRPLRDVGWSVDVGEPDERALYVKVIATSGDTKIRIALLYSCGTGNSLYRKLAEDSDVILYRGAPYKQEQFAYGLNVHVGPVTGWQPPIANKGKSA